MESKYARIGRTYPRPAPQPPAAETQHQLAHRYRITGALIVVLSALGLLGWLFAR